MSPLRTPRLVYAAVDRTGAIIFSHASGKTGLGQEDPMTLDTVFYMTFCTKLLTSIACMQLVEQGKLALDDSDQLQSLASELRDVQMVAKERRLTLRMLLNHPSGFGYAFEDLKLLEWSRPVGLDDFSGNTHDVLHRPLVNQPGTKFQYGRVTGISLEEYFQAFILRPLGVENITFCPTDDMKANPAYMHQRAKDGSLSVTDHLYRYPLLPCSPEEGGKRCCMGGAGCFGKPVEYCRIIATLLNDGTSPNTGTKLLQPGTVQEMFTDQIPTMPRYCNEYTPSGKPLLANPCPLVPCADDLTEGWGLSFALSHTKSSTGRAAGSGSWEGLPSLFWFADRENGVGGIIASQILPYGDLEVLGCSERVESIIYEHMCGN
ncbi:beta-lactamase family protein [Aspergillus uvarum CBS 121591]|uniref:Beta-lactamase family protein n=1 Tax=Aspergillus uvarum CBS 121591 TaxID=1448315 RepID=A0A319CKW9_9EURO|nr:beta-lactamase family protein [Aspergillus uvarum CBS 121591]PYH85844.1 beta-lactamase family protein [Aspergillus uvarum CBS 121591]